jgi:hypothetical protein
MWIISPSDLGETPRKNTTTVGCLKVSHSWIEVARLKKGIVLSQHKYILETWTYLVIWG